MAEVEIGIGKSGRRAYGFDDIAIVPSRRTRDPEDVDISWNPMGSYNFPLPMMAAAMDSSVSPTTAHEISRLGGLPVLNLEGLWTRFENAQDKLDKIGALEQGEATKALQLIYNQPILPHLIPQRVAEAREGGGCIAVSITPQRVIQYYDQIVEANPDFLVIQGTVVSAEHVSNQPGVDPLNLKRFIRDQDMNIMVGNCASYEGALHLMRTGATCVMIGVGPGQGCTSRGVLGIGVPQATAIADAAGARMRHLDETGVYVQIIADGGMSRGGEVAKAIALGADAVMIGSPLASSYNSPCPGRHWGMATPHADLPRGALVETGMRGTLEEILVGPAHENDGLTNLFGALKTSMATCGYESVKEFQKAEVIVAPALQTEGKSLQKAQGVGMGAK